MDPNYSETTTAHDESTFGITTSLSKEGVACGDLYYVWGRDGDFIRLYNSAEPTISASGTLSLWVYGNNSSQKIRLSVRDTDGDLLASDYTTIYFTGWSNMSWDIDGSTPTCWEQHGDGLLTGPTVQWESIQLYMFNQYDTDRHLYFDAATCTTDTPLSWTAGIQYEGIYKLVYLAFPFETILEGNVRNEVMTRTLDFFEPEEPATPTPTFTPTSTPYVPSGVNYWQYE